MEIWGSDREEPGVISRRAIWKIALYGVGEVFGLLPEFVYLFTSLPCDVIAPSLPTSNSWIASFLLSACVVI